MLLPQSTRGVDVVVRLLRRHVCRHCTSPPDDRRAPALRGLRGGDPVARRLVERTRVRRQSLAVIRPTFYSCRLSDVCQWDSQLMAVDRLTRLSVPDRRGPELVAACSRDRHSRSRRCLAQSLGADRSRPTQVVALRASLHVARRRSDPKRDRRAHRPAAGIDFSSSFDTRQGAQARAVGRWQSTVILLGSCYAARCSSSL